MRSLPTNTLITVAVVFLVACSVPEGNKSIYLPTERNTEKENKMQETPKDQSYVKQEGMEVIYLAGGCFWGLEKLMQSIPGVVDVVSG
ncbi:MAG: peptide-methionine (S)-S-oxide reductase, partial [Anaerolineales bacterium]